jgi:hypothetical protein
LTSSEDDTGDDRVIDIVDFFFVPLSRVGVDDVAFVVVAVLGALVAPFDDGADLLVSLDVVAV